MHTPIDKINSSAERQFNFDKEKFEDIKNKFKSYFIHQIKKIKS